jgi:hypothetical protein
MGTDLSERIAHPVGDRPEVEEWSAVAETFAGRVHIEWDTTAPVTPLGQLPLGHLVTIWSRLRRQLLKPFVVTLYEALSLMKYVL